MTSRPLLRVFVVILIIDVALILAHRAYSASAGWPRGDVGIRLDKDRGYGELFGSGKLVVASALLFRVWLTDRVAVATAWGASMLLLVADDLAGIHERFGNRLTLFDSVAPGRSQEIGELVCSESWGWSSLR